jgi:hypothetical protein
MASSIRVWTLGGVDVGVLPNQPFVAAEARASVARTKGSQ